MHRYLPLTSVLLALAGCAMTDSATVSRRLAEAPPAHSALVSALGSMLWEQKADVALGEALTERGVTFALAREYSLPTEHGSSETMRVRVKAIRAKARELKLDAVLTIIARDLRTRTSTHVDESKTAGSMVVELSVYSIEAERKVWVGETTIRGDGSASLDDMMRAAARICPSPPRCSIIWAEPCTTMAGSTKPLSSSNRR